MVVFNNAKLTNLVGISGIIGTASSGNAMHPQPYIIAVVNLQIDNSSCLPHDLEQIFWRVLTGIVLLIMCDLDLSFWVFISRKKTIMVYFNIICEITITIWMIMHKCNKTVHDNYLPLPLYIQVSLKQRVLIYILNVSSFLVWLDDTVSC